MKQTKLKPQGQGYLTNPCLKVWKTIYFVVFSFKTPACTPNLDKVFSSLESTVFFCKNNPYLYKEQDKILLHKTFTKCVFFSIKKVTQITVTKI